MRKVVALIPVLLVLALFASTVYADDSITYSINDWHIHAAVNQDGSMNVKEYITYKVSPEHEGPVKRDINISRASYMDELSVSVVTTVDPEDITRSEVEPYKLVDNPEQLVEGTYAVQPGANADEIQEVHIYLPDDTQEKTFVLSYKLLDFAFLYRDTAAVFWNPVVTGYGNGIQNIDIRFSLQKVVGTDTIHSFVYGALDGESLVLEDGTINITGYDLKPEEFMDVTVLFPKTAVDEGRKLIDNDAMQKVLQEEQAKMEEMELLREKREQERRFRKTVTILVAAGVLAIILCGCLLYVRNRHIRKDKEKPDKADKHMQMPYNVSDKARQLMHRVKTGSRGVLDQIKGKLPKKKEVTVFDNLPADYYSPAELSVLMHGRGVRSRDVAATLMDLVVRRYIEIKAVETDDDRYYVFRLKDYQANSLKAHEEYLVNWFFKDVGDGNEVTSKAIKQAAYGSGSVGLFSTKFIVWKKLVLNQAWRWKFWEREGIFRWYKRTEFGVNHYKEWIEFRKFLKGMGNDVGSIPYDKLETYLVYAFPLGIAGQVVKALKAAFADGTPIDDQLTILNGLNFHAFDEWFSLINSFNFLRNITTKLRQRISSVSRIVVKNRDRAM
ncbi:MAG: DUF2207 domain-containing protein [Clostridiales bacterium]|nr:DUF2207 domain-containing protein [Clostridiales bacterium]